MGQAIRNHTGHKVCQHNPLQSSTNCEVQILFMAHQNRVRVCVCVCQGIDSNQNQTARPTTSAMTMSSVSVLGLRFPKTQVPVLVHKCVYVSPPVCAHTR